MSLAEAACWLGTKTGASADLCSAKGQLTCWRLPPDNISQISRFRFSSFGRECGEVGLADGLLSGLPVMREGCGSHSSDMATTRTCDPGKTASQNSTNQQGFGTLISGRISKQHCRRFQRLGQRSLHRSRKRPFSGHLGDTTGFPQGRGLRYRAF
jgi:hypothetical protein